MTEPTTAARVLIGHFYDEARARDLAAQFVALGHPAERFAVERDRFGEWLVYDKGNAPDGERRPTTTGPSEAHMSDEPFATAARRRVPLDVLWVIYTALMLVSVAIAITERTWDSISVACIWCFLRGRWRP